MPFIKVTDWPSGFVTITSYVPGFCTGVTTFSVVELTKVTLAAATPPKVTDGVAVKLVPMIVTESPPVLKTLDGITELLVGGRPGVVAGLEADDSGPFPMALVA